MKNYFLLLLILSMSSLQIKPAQENDTSLNQSTYFKERWDEFHDHLYAQNIKMSDPWARLDAWKLARCFEEQLFPTDIFDSNWSRTKESISSSLKKYASFENPQKASPTRIEAFYEELSIALSAIYTAHPELPVGQLEQLANEALHNLEEFDSYLEQQLTQKIKTAVPDFNPDAIKAIMKEKHQTALEEM